MDAVKVSVFGIGPQMLQKGIMSSPRPVTWLDSVHFKYWDSIPTRTRDLITNILWRYNFIFGSFPLVAKLKLPWEGGWEGLEQRLLGTHINFAAEAWQNKWGKKQNPKGFNATHKILSSAILWIDRNGWYQIVKISTLWGCSCYMDQRRKVLAAGT